MSEPETPEFVTIFMTASDREEADKIGRTLVGDRLVACANVLGDVTSYFRWDGDVQVEGEVVVVAKSRSSLVPDITARVTEIHSYDCPCIVASPLVGGNKEYLAWIRLETRDA